MVICLTDTGKSNNEESAWLRNFLEGAFILSVLKLQWKFLSLYAWGQDFPLSVGLPGYLADIFS